MATVLMTGDVPDGTSYEPGSTISVWLSGDDELALPGCLRRSRGGRQPLMQAPWDDHFGACIDRFGISWMVNIGSSPT